MKKRIKKQTRVFTLEDFRRWGKRGGKTTSKLYGKNKAKEWGKLGAKARWSKPKEALSK